MCVGCLISERERQELLIQKEKEAKKHAVESQKIMVLYNLPDSSISFMEAETARAAGITPIKYISFLQ